MTALPVHSLADSDTNMTTLTLEDLTVQRGELPLCVGVNLELAAGSICHLIGANGTGKTTLLMQLAGLLPVLTGAVHYQGQAGLPVQPLYVSHQLGIHSSLTVAQNLTFLLNLYGVSPTLAEVDEALEWVGLQGFEALSSSHLSAGQTRRITLARLYLLTPQMTPLWLLDEPFTALDVDMVARMEHRLCKFAAAGGSILMTSHQSVGVADHVLDLSESMV
nr:heme ABC exporter ATP-binding protein CcmA [uncultured Psychrobacter sp.]